MAEHETDKTRFGEFVARERREQGMTQRELAQKLFISDKAVSKWERGLSLPDVTLLIPLAEALGVTVTELLEGRRMPADGDLGMDRVEQLVKRTLSLTEDPPERERVRRRKRVLVWAGCGLLAAAELAFLWLFAYLYKPALLLREELTTLVLVAFFCGGWFWIGAKERLPAYYDENVIHYYSDGIFRMDMPGMRFHNGNWPHILQWVRGWSAAAMVGAMPLGLLLELAAGSTGGGIVLLLVFLGGLFLPVYRLGKKYE